MKLFTLSLCVFLISVAAIQHKSPINDRDFRSLAKVKDHETSLVQVIEPLDVPSFVELLSQHSTTYLKRFLENFVKAAKGSWTYASRSSYEQLTQDNYNVLIQDYMPINEAETASAKYLFNLEACQIRSTSNAIPAGMTACQYHGAKLLSDIVRRMTTVHSYLTLGTPNPKLPTAKAVNLITPPEWNEQVSRIIGLLGSQIIQDHLAKVDPAAGQVWADIKGKAVTMAKS